MGWSWWMRPDETLTVSNSEKQHRPGVRRRLFDDNCDQKVIVEYINNSPPLPFQFVMNIDPDDTVYCDVLTDDKDTNEDDEDDEDIQQNRHCLLAEENQTIKCNDIDLSDKECVNKQSRTKSDDWDSVNGSQETYSEFSGLHDYCIDPNKGIECDNCTDDDGNEVESLDWLLDFSLDSLLENGCKPKENRNKSYDCNNQTRWKPQQYHSSKPPYNYGQLIQLALKEKGQLTVDDIYNWIRIKFPYYRFQDDKRWKAGIRHKLSTHAAFVKTSKSATKRGHLWSYVVNDGASTKLTMNKNHWKKQKIADYRNDVRQESVSVATASINLSKTAKAPKPARNPHHQNSVLSQLITKHASPAPPSLLLQELTATKTSHHSPLHRSARSLHTRDLTPVTLVNEQGLCVTPEQVSPGVTQAADTVIPQKLSVLHVSGSPSQVSRFLYPKQNVTYAYLVQNTAFLNPVSPGEVMKECGLMDDPPSTNTIMSLPTYNIHPADSDTSQELFDGVL